MGNGRFSITVHILTLLARAGDDLLSSEYIAGSININPVLVRKELSNLRKHNLIISKEGKGGGSSLAKPAGSITLAEVYDIVREAPVLGKARNQPNPICPVGKDINKHLDDLYLEVEQSLMTRLGKTTLAAFSNRFS